MDYFNNNVHFYSSSTAAGNFDPYPVPSSAPATGAGVAQTLDASTVGASYWDTVEQLGPMANPWWDIPIQANHGKHHSHRLVDWRLTRDLQIRWPLPPQV